MSSAQYVQLCEKGLELANTTPVLLLKFKALFVRKLKWSPLAFQAYLSLIEQHFKKEEAASKDLLVKELIPFIKGHLHYFDHASLIQARRLFYLQFPPNKILSQAFKQAVMQKASLFSDDNLVDLLWEIRII